jgi:hypothetical protein
MQDLGYTNILNHHDMKVARQDSQEQVFQPVMTDAVVFQQNQASRESCDSRDIVSFSGLFFVFGIFDRILPPTVVYVMITNRQESQDEILMAT